MRRLLAFGAAAAILLAACGSSDNSSATTSQTTPSTSASSPAPGDPKLQELWTGLERPLFVTAPPNDERVFVVEQPGTIRVAAGHDSPLADGAWLDISDEINDKGERGLLGMAFAPDFATSGKFYLNYTDNNSDTQIVEFEVDPAAGTQPATVKNRRTVLELPQPFANHNAGMLAFGPDGLLYVGTGDGGSGNDPRNNAQNPDHLLGKMLRVDVADGRDDVETYAIGLRNPYRFSFDSKTGDLWIGDVGQNDFEEVDVIRAGTPPGVNLGWRIFEGNQRNTPGEIDHHGPVTTYPLGGDDCAVVGGYVYRGSDFPQLDGRYFFGDFCSGLIRTLDAGAPGDVAVVNDVLDAPQMQISSFGVDAAERLYVVDHGGSVYLIA